MTIYIANTKNIEYLTLLFSEAIYMLVLSGISVL